MRVRDILLCRFRRMHLTSAKYGLRFVVSRSDMFIYFWRVQISGIIFEERESEVMWMWKLG